VATLPYLKPPTIHDVARVSKLSKSTVSNVIRNAVGVHPQTRERVKAAILELGYQTNIVARQLVQQRTSVLGMVIGDLANPFHAEMAKLIEGFTAPLGYQVMVCNTRMDAALEVAGIRSMLEHRVAGLLFLCCRDAAERARHLVAGRVPTVSVGGRAGWGDVVAVDDVAGAQAATGFLIAEGHRRIWHFAGLSRNGTLACDRQAGYRQAMTQAGLAPVTFGLDAAGESVVIDGTTMPLAHALTGDGAPTGIVAVDDVAAIRVMDIAERLGLAIPERLSVVGFDDASFASHARFGLTTVAQPKEALAQLAVETLLRRVAGDSSEALARQLLDFRLVVRRSTAPPGAAQPVRNYPGAMSGPSRRDVSARKSRTRAAMSCQGAASQARQASPEVEGSTMIGGISAAVGATGP
jgi:LacI family transcriptional regulator